MVSPSCKKKCTLVTSSTIGHKRRQPLANFKHVRKRGYQALTRDGWHVSMESNAELRRLIYNHAV